jgi:hypothetical protein
MALLFPSMMDSVCYESNGGSGLHGFCVFLSFRLSVNIVLWFLYDYCKMLAFLREVMGVFYYKVWALVIDSVSLVFYDDSLWKMVTMVQHALSLLLRGFTTSMGISCCQPFFLSVVVVILYPSFNATVDSGVVLFG